MTASTCGPNSGEAGRSRSSPIVLMLIMRGSAPGSRSGRCSAGVLIGKLPEQTAARRRPRWRQAPTSAGRQAIVAHRHAAAAHALQRRS